MKYFLLVLAIFSTPSIFAQEFADSDFEKIEVPQKNSNDLYKLNNSVLGVQPYRDSIGKIKFRIYKRGNDGAGVKTNYGTFFCINRGEWGGGLYYQPYQKLPRKFYINGSQAKMENNPWRSITY